MKHEDIVCHEELYFDCRKRAFCVIVGCHEADGACLIAERFDMTERDLTDEIFYSEACQLQALGPIDNPLPEDFTPMGG